MPVDNNGNIIGENPGNIMSYDGKDSEAYPENIMHRDAGFKKEIATLSNDGNIFGNSVQRYSDPVATKVINIGAGQTDGFITNANTGIAPTDYVHTWYDFDTGHVILDKYVASVKTTLIDVAAAYVADKKLITVCQRSGANLLVDVFYNGAQVGTTQTISDSAIVHGTYHYAGGDGSGTFAVRRYGLGAELITLQNDRDYSGESVGSWIKSTDGSGTLLYDGVNPAGEKVLALTAAGDETFLSSQLAEDKLGVITDGDLLIYETQLYAPAANTLKKVRAYMNLFGALVTTTATLSADTWTKVRGFKLIGADITGFFKAGFDGSPAAGDVLYQKFNSVRKVLLP